MSDSDLETRENTPGRVRASLTKQPTTDVYTYIYIYVYMYVYIYMMHICYMSIPYMHVCINYMVPLDLNWLLGLHHG